MHYYEPFSDEILGIYRYGTSTLEPTQGYGYLLRPEMVGIKSAPVLANLQNNVEC